MALLVLYVFGFLATWVIVTSAVVLNYENKDGGRIGDWLLGSWIGFWCGLFWPATALWFGVAAAVRGITMAFRKGD